MDLLIRPMRPDDIKPAVDIHIASFPTFFLSSLGRGFLRELYRGFLRSDSAVHYVAESNDRVCGVVLGTVKPVGFFGQLLRARWWAFGWAAASAVVRRPKITRRVARALFYRGDPPAGPSRALLSSIAVAPDAQGTGVGKALVTAWVAEASRRGVAGCYLTTDADGNESVNSFYRRCGWRLDSTFSTPEGRRMNRYVLDFSIP